MVFVDEARYLGRALFRGWICRFKGFKIVCSFRFRL